MHGRVTNYVERIIACVIRVAKMGKLEDHSSMRFAQRLLANPQLALCDNLAEQLDVSKNDAEK